MCKRPILQEPIHEVERLNGKCQCATTFEKPMKTTTTTSITKFADVGDISMMIEVHSFQMCLVSAETDHILQLQIATKLKNLLIDPVNFFSLAPKYR
jgi:hypothetical protein